MRTELLSVNGERYGPSVVFAGDVCGGRLLCLHGTAFILLSTASCPQTCGSISGLSLAPLTPVCVYTKSTPILTTSFAIDSEAT